MEKIGDGVYGTVFYDKASGDAIKKCSHEESRIIWAGNVREMDILRRCGHHPNIVTLKKVSFGDPEDPNFNKLNLHLEYYPTNLRKFIQGFEHERVDLTSIRIIMVQILLGLEYLHVNKIVHRDIKPDNILINPETLQVAICDFGMCDISMRYRKSEKKVTAPFYRAPEVIRGFKYSYEVDLWAVGLIFFYMIQGTNAYKYPYKEEKEITEEIELRQAKIRSGCDNPDDLVDEIKLLRQRSSNLMFEAIKTIDIRKTFPGNYPFKNLLMGLLQIEPRQRLSATEALKSNFFNSVRHTYIDATHKEFPLKTLIMRKIYFEDIPERKWMTKYTFKYIRENPDVSPENLYPVIFHGLDLFEKYLYYLMMGEFTRDDSSSGKYISERETYLYLYTCFYLAHKYYAVTLIPYDFEEFFPDDLLTMELMEKAEEFERYLLEEVIDYKVFDYTLYEITEEMINNPQENDYNKILKEYLTVSQTTKKFNSYRSLYRETFFKKTLSH